MNRSMAWVLGPVAVRRSQNVGDFAKAGLSKGVMRESTALKAWMSQAM